MIMASMILLLLCYIALTSSLFISHCLAASKGFTIEMIHRDSPKSPFYDPAASPSELLSQAVNRSNSRAERFNAVFSNKTVTSPVSYGDAQYHISFYVGTPRILTLAILDTGSGIMWIQCEPCKRCYPQRSPVSYNSRNSLSYKPVYCNSPLCNTLIKYSPRKYKCDTPNDGPCNYDIRYGDSSSSHGELGHEVFTFASSAGSFEVVNVLFGCGRENYLKPSPNVAMGIAGLDRGEFSLLTQLGYDNFAYCLVPRGSRKQSTLNFGDEATIPDGPGVARTPLGYSSPSGFFFLTIEAITIGSTRVDYPKKYADNMLIDSGTTLTLVDPDFLDGLEHAFDKEYRVRPVRNLDRFRFCYFEEEVVRNPLPKLVVYFDEGSNVEWNIENAFVNIHEDESYLCLAMVGRKDVAIYGMLAQTNFKVEYNIMLSQLTFKPQTCGN